MTSTDRLAETAEDELRAKFGDAAVEILRLRVRDLAAFDEIRQLRARITELEGQVSSLISGAASLATRALAAETERAVTFGTMERPTPDEPATITHGHAPSAPPHDEPQPPIGHTIKWPARTGDDNE